MAELSAKRQRFNKWFDANYTGDESLVKEFEGKKILMKRAPGENKPQDKGDSMSFMDRLKDPTNIGGKEGAKGAMDAMSGGGSPMSKGLQAGLSTGNPYVAAGAAIMGIAQQKAENKKIQKMGEARATTKMAEGEKGKADIQGQIASSIRQTLGSANRQRQVNL